MRSEVRILSGAMSILSGSFGPVATNQIIVVCSVTQQAAVFDAPLDSARELKKTLNRLSVTPTALYLTHSHWDHIADTAEIHENWGLSIWIHELDAGNLRDPGSDGVPGFLPLSPCEPTGLLREGQECRIGEISLRVIHTPGHSPGSICFYCQEEGWLISGDTLFQGSIGRLDLSTAEPEKMWTSLAKLASLPAETLVYPGHGATTRIGDEPWLAHARTYFGDN